MADPLEEQDRAQWWQKMGLPAGAPAPTMPSSIGPGWHPLLLTTHKALAHIAPDYRLDQVKEKFGRLRVYFSVPSQGAVAGMQKPADEDRPRIERMLDITGFAEAVSATICEDCGAPGRECNPNGSWIKTLCERCEQGRVR